MEQRKLANLEARKRFCMVNPEARKGITSVNPEARFLENIAVLVIRDFWSKCNNFNIKLFMNDGRTHHSTQPS